MAIEESVLKITLLALIQNLMIIIKIPLNHALEKPIQLILLTKLKQSIYKKQKN